MCSVSVITIFLNSEAFIAEAIDSVLAQDFRSFELILVDDGSTDTSSAIARRYAETHPDRVRYIDHPQHANHGMSASRNAGIWLFGVFENAQARTLRVTQGAPKLLIV